MQVVATDAALAAIERLTAEYGGVMFMQSGGCCDGSSPICLPAGELCPGIAACLRELPQTLRGICAGWMSPVRR